MQSKWKVLPLAILTALSLTACGGEKAEKVEPENKQVEVSMDEVDDTNLINISAVDLSDDYRSNEPISDKEYRGQRAEIVGTIDSINELDGDTYLSLSGSEKDGSPLVHCFFNEELETSELNPGDEVTLIGSIFGKKELNGDRNNIIVENSKLK